MIALLIFLYPYTAKADAPSEENETFSVLSSTSLPITGVSIAGVRNQMIYRNTELRTTPEVWLLVCSMEDIRYCKAKRNNSDIKRCCSLV